MEIRSLPKLLREAERRVNAHVFKRGGDDSLASIPANRDRDVDLLLMEAAEVIERQQADLDLLMRCGCIVRESAITGGRFVELSHSATLAQQEKP